MSWTTDRTSEQATLISTALVLMFIASLLRFPGIGGQSLWIDEVTSLHFSKWPVGTMLSVEDGHPPLYALIMKAVCPWLATDFCGRIVSAVFGVASVGVMFWLGTWLYNFRTGFFAAVLLTVSPMHVWYSREGRMYAMLTFWSIFSSLFIKQLLEKRRWYIYAAYCFATLGGILTHYTYVSVVIAQGLFMLPRFRLHAIRKQSLFIGGVVLTILGIAIFPMVKESITYGPLGSVREFELLALPYTLFVFVAGFGIGPPLAELHRDRSLQALQPYWSEVTMVIIIGTIVLLIGLLALFKRKEPGHQYLFLWMVIPPVLAASISWSTGLAYNVRYVIISLPAFVLIVALGLAQNRLVYTLTALAILIIISSISIARDRLDPRYFREDMGSTAQYLESTLEQEDRIVLSTATLILNHYYSGSQVIEPLPIRPVRTEAEATQVISRLSQTEQTTWLVFHRDWEEDPEGLLKKQLAASKNVKLTARFPGVVVYRIGK